MTSRPVGQEGHCFLVVYFFVEKILGVASLCIEILRSFLRKCGSE